LITQGQLKQAASFCEETIAHHLADQSRNPVPYLGFVYSKLGEVLYEWDDLDGANHNLEHGLALADQLMVAWSWTRDGLVYLARLRQIQGDFQAAQAFIERAIAMSGQMQDLFDRIDISYWQARLWLARNTLTAAARWAREYQANVEIHTEAADIVLARVFLALGETGQAFGILKPISEAAGATERTYAQIETLILQALAYQAQADSLQAQTALAQALSLAEPEGFVRLFVDEGSPMTILLRQLAGPSQRTLGGEFLFSQEYVTRLLAAFPEAETSVSRPVAEEGALKERELQVLRLMAAGLKTPEIAEELHLSNNTIKWYLRNLYGKLGVHSKAEAIAEGHKLGFLK
jgi:LuxR family maltose regulon positive regulatory protein